MAFQLDIVTPEKTIFSDQVDDVYLPGSEGEMGVLSMHSAMVTPLQPGELRYLKDGKNEDLAIGEGFAEVTQEKVTVLTDLAVNDAEIDEAKVEEAMKRAQDALEGVADS
ncbi:ATP synthase F1 subunit epsilon, partial [bacterium]|nr:ATP synthase F1 subunit epsilon [bacterium]